MLLAGVLVSRMLAGGLGVLRRRLCGRAVVGVAGAGWCTAWSESDVLDVARAAASPTRPGLARTVRITRFRETLFINSQAMRRDDEKCTFDPC